MADMRVWIGCLGCYNGGSLEGKWFDAEDCPTMMEEWDEAFHDTEARVFRLPGMHFAEGHEELWVMDHEGFGALIQGECSPMTAREIAEAVSDLDEDELRAFGPWFRESSWSKVDDATVADFRDNFRGIHEKASHYAQDFAEEIFHETFANLPDPIKYAIDWEQCDEYMQSEGYYTTITLSHNEVAVFGA